MFRFFLPLTVLGVLVSACVRDDDPAPPTAGTAGSAGATGSGGVASFTLANVCDLLPARVCDIRSDCCLASGVGFDQWQCEAESHSECLSHQDHITAGEMTFDPVELDACLKEWSKLAQRCDKSVYDWAELSGPLESCRRAFRGTQPQHGTCKYDEDCSLVLAPASESYTTCEAGSCHLTARTAEWSPCSADEGPVRGCEDGLACVGPSGGSICMSAVEHGDECGVGLYCLDTDYCAATTDPADIAALRCKTRKDLEQVCFGNDECTSNLCVGGHCRRSGPLFTPAQCGKEP